MAKKLSDIREEIANAVGTGAIAGAGVPLEGKPDNWGEPGVSKKNQRKHKTRILRRKKSQLEK